ncbi:ankyrin, partial [Aspergillus indologenus CBS 114.80]
MAVAALLRAAHESGCTHDVLHERDAAGRWPLHWAVDNGHIDIVETLLKMDMSTDDDEAKDQAYTPLGYAAERGLTGIVRVLLQYGANINSGGPQKGTPLLIAAQHNQEGIVRLLLEQRTTQRDGKSHHININTPDPLSRNTPLHLAAGNGNVTIMGLLLSHPAGLMPDIEAQTDAQETPLHLAAAHPRAAAILLDAGANVGAEDIRRQTP